MVGLIIFIGVLVLGALSVLFGLASVWLGVAIAYAAPSVPPSTAIIGVAVTIYVLAAVGARAVQHHVVAGDGVA